MGRHARRAALGEPGDPAVLVPRKAGRPSAFLSFDFEPVMPAQWFAGRERDVSLQPEKRLMLAVLGDAVDLLLRSRDTTCPRRRRLVDEAERWITSDDRRWAFSFVNLCDAVGIDPATVRHGLTRLIG